MPASTVVGAGLGAATVGVGSRKSGIWNADGPGAGISARRGANGIPGRAGPWPSGDRTPALGGFAMAAIGRRFGGIMRALSRRRTGSAGRLDAGDVFGTVGIMCSSCRTE